MMVNKYSVGNARKVMEPIDKKVSLPYYSPGHQIAAQILIQLEYRVLYWKCKIAPDGGDKINQLVLGLLNALFSTATSLGGYTIHAHLKNGMTLFLTALHTNKTIHVAKITTLNRSSEQNDVCSNFQISTHTN